MTPLPRARTSEGVAEYLLGLLFDGRLRGGDRIDLDEVARNLGVSRVPVREGLMHLERDGLVTMPHYRGAFVAPFGTETIQEAFDMYGLLSAVTFRRVAADPPDDLLETITKLDEMLAGTTDVDEFERVAREIRRVVNVAGAGPNLRALLRSFGGLVPAAARFSIVDAMEEERGATHAEVQAVRSRDPEAAATATLDHIAMTARNAIAALRRRGVISGGETGNADDHRVHLDLVRRVSPEGRSKGGRR
jgi:DNA-binding GntR family transcriptional regulator